MIVCPSCGKEQEEKDLCEDCGASLAEDVQKEPVREEEVPESEVEPAADDAKPNEAVERVKDVGLSYWQFVKGSLLSPSAYFEEREHSLVNSIINVVLFSFFMALASLLYMRKIVGMMFWADLPGFGFFMGILILTIIYFAIIAGLMFVANILFGDLKSIKLVFNTYSSFLTIPIVFAIFTFLVVAVGILKFGVSLIAFTFFLAFGINPLYIVTILFTRSSNKIDAFLGVLAYKIVALIIFAIVMQLFVKSMIEDILGGLIGF